MADLNGFDANEIEPSAIFEPIPSGKYKAVIIDSDLKPTKAGNGSYLELVFEICEGEYAGRKLWVRLNVDNPNAKAVEIAQRDLSAICWAVDVLKPTDSVDLHHLPLMIQVVCKKRKDTEEMANEIKGYFPKEVPSNDSSVVDAAEKTADAPWKPK